MAMRQADTTQQKMEANMSDFTGLSMHDQYRAIVSEREREIASSLWRRKWKELHATDASPQCCSTDGDVRAQQGPVGQRALSPNS
jgi:hypothetical protein